MLRVVRRGPAEARRDHLGVGRRLGARRRALSTASLTDVVSLLFRRLRCGGGLSVRRPMRLPSHTSCVVERRPTPRPPVREVVREVRGARVRIQREPLWEVSRGR